MDFTTLAWINDARAGLREFYAFMSNDESSAMLVMGAGLMIGRKVYRHFSKKTAYDLRDFWKYPGEWLELAIIALLFLVGLSVKAVC